MGKTRKTKKQRTRDVKNLKAAIGATEIERHRDGGSPEIAKMLRGLEMFPELSPEPVLRIAGDGKLLYANGVAKMVIKGWKTAVGKKVPKRWKRAAEKALRTGKCLMEEEVAGGRVWSFSIAPVKGSGYVNLSGRDITELRVISDEREFLASFPSDSLDPVIRIAGDGKILYANDAAKKVIKSWNPGIGKKVPVRWRKVAEKALITGKRRLEEEIVAGRVWSFGIAPVKGAENVTLYGRDITELKKAEAIISEKNINLSMANQQLRASEQQLTASNQQLRASEQQLTTINQELRVAAAQQKLSQEKLKQLFESMNSGVAVYNAVKGGDNFVFAGINRSAEKIEKVKRKDVVGKKVTDVFPGIKKFGLFRVLKRVWETGKSEKYTMKFYVDERRSGWRDNYVYKLPSGEVVAIYQDTTAIVETNKMVADLAKFPKENPSPVYRISGQGELIYSNDAGKKLLECKVCSIGGKGLIDGLKGKVKKTLLSRKIVVCEVECNKKIYSFNLAPIMSGGYVNVYGTDITDRIKGEEALKEAKLQLIQLNEGLESRVRQQVEELRQSNERVIASEKLATIGRLAAGIAHELNSPLSGILALLWTRSKGGGVVEGEETKMILSACENMAKIIRDLNLFARTSVLEKTELDLVGLLEGVVNLSLSRARVNSAEIERK